MINPRPFLVLLPATVLAALSPLPHEPRVDGEHDAGIIRSRDGRFTLEADMSPVDAPTLAGGDFVLEADIQSVEMETSSTSGFEVTATLTDSLGEPMIITDLFAPGSGVVPIDGDLVLCDDATTVLQIAAPTDERGSCLLVAGVAELGGRLVIESPEDLAAGPAAEYIVLTADSIVGRFDEVEWLAAPADLDWRLEVREDVVVVVIESKPH